MVPSTNSSMMHCSNGIVNVNGIDLGGEKQTGVLSFL
jgi:hypothetical protein